MPDFARLFGIFAGVSEWLGKGYFCEPTKPSLNGVYGLESTHLGIHFEVVPHG